MKANFKIFEGFV